MNLKLHTFIICFLLLKNSAVIQFGMVVDISVMLKPHTIAECVFVHFESCFWLMMANWSGWLDNAR